MAQVSVVILVGLSTPGNSARFSEVSQRAFMSAGLLGQSFKGWCKVSHRRISPFERA